MALSVAMLASTRLPMPVVSASESCDTKFDWIENFAEPLDSFDRAESTLTSELSIVATMVDAFDCVEMVAVELTETIEPERLIFSAAAVILCVPSADASAVIWVVEPLIRLKPLNCAFWTTDAIWSRRAVKFEFNA
jgi:hypothetical protein